MPKYNNVSSDEISAFYATGNTIKHVAPAFCAPSQQAATFTRRDISRQRQQQRRDQRTTRERERLSTLYGASDPYAAMLAMQCGSE